MTFCVLSSNVWFLFTVVFSPWHALVARFAQCSQSVPSAPVVSNTCLQVNIRAQVSCLLTRPIIPLRAR